LANGQLTLQNAAFNYAGLPAGLSKANGRITFDGNSATVRNLTGEAGGGKITLSGFASYSDKLRFSLQMNATRVRLLIQEGVTVTASTNVQATGTSTGSVVSGSAVVDQVFYNPHTDIGALLSRATPVVENPSSSPLLEKMKLDIRIRAASSLTVQAQMAENLSATIDLHVQGTAAQPGLLGRVTVNEGQLVFFGATYTINTGVIAFYNPSQINPTVDLSLETQTQGVDIVVRVSGAMDNLKLSYTSNPPLAFQEIVGLLAAGKTPTSDPTLLANQPDTPPASLQQTGESAVLGEAVANPVANRLQRVFGVSQLSLAPQFQTGSQTPTARLSLTQRVTSNLTFTYTSALDDPNGEIVSVEWTFDPKWSAVATRDQNGIFSINFFYKRQFR
jgi:translocation and assembly module TamB